MVAGMLFIEPRFIYFFVIVFAGHWALRRNDLRKLWLLAASYVFYAAWDWRFLSLIVASTLIDYTAGVLMARPLPDGRRKACLVMSLVGNLGILGFFKYCNFFIESAVGFTELLGFPLEARTLNLILPVGISFYTFQTLSYTIDVYRGRLEPTRKMLDLALFVGFFPQLVAGPIVRASDFLPQLRARRVFSSVPVRACLTLFLIGFVKKACVSDNLAPVVDAYFADPASYSLASAWIAVLFYAVQIYCDFSGYSDMAIACANLLGYRLCINFNFPYFAVSITEFWRRWHISLSSWLRDYLYISLGGNRGSKLFTYRNLMLTMLLGGLWHGASWTFVIWGGLHGLALVVHKEWCRLRASRPNLLCLPRFAGLVFTFYWVCVAWVFFRSSDFATASVVLKAFVLFQADGVQSVGLDLAWVLPCLVVAHWVAYNGFFARRLQELADWTFAAGYGFVTTLAITIVPSNYHPFIYFQF